MPDRENAPDKTTGTLELRPGSRATVEQVECGLTMLALSSGQARRASRELVAQGYNVGESTLRSWRDMYPERYTQLREKEAPALAARIAEGRESLIVRGLEIKHELMDRLAGNTTEIPIKDVPKSLKDLGIFTAIEDDKLRLQRGEPTQITETRDIGEIIRSLKSKGVEFIDAEAEEIPPASLPDSASPKETLEDTDTEG